MGTKSIESHNQTRYNMNKHQDRNFIPSRDGCWLANSRSIQLEASKWFHTTYSSFKRAHKSVQELKTHKRWLGFQGGVLGG